MMGTSGAQNIELADVYDILEEVDFLVGLAFSDTSQGTIQQVPTERYRVLALLLHGFGEYAPANAYSDVVDELSTKASPEAARTVARCGQEMKDLLRRLGIAPTYSATSYWSPIDRRRHTVTHRRAPAHSQERAHSLACAYAFYALSFAGAPHGLSSVIQYTSEKARRKRGVRVSYMTECPGSPSWWHIPPDTHEVIMGRTGILAAIHRDVRGNGNRSERELEQLLGGVLANERSNSWVDIDNFAERFISKFLTLKGDTNTQLQATLDATKRLLSTTFETDDINDRLALFMLMTHLLYKEACPTKYIYTYPVRVAETCCVMTIGTDEYLTPIADLALSHFVRSLFSVPLLQDYAALEAMAKVDAERSALWEETALQAAHQIGTPVATVVWKLELLEEYLIRQDERRIRSTLTALREQASRANDRIYDFKRLSGVHNLRPTKVQLRPFLDLFVCDAQEHGFICEADVPDDLFVMIDQQRMSQCFEEVLKNATRWCLSEPRILRISADHARSFPSRLKQNQAYVEIHVRDNGPGVPADLKDRIFEQFFTTYRHGTGLGLTHVKRVIEAHQGSMQEVGTHGQGADFAIWLPEVTVR